MRCILKCASFVYLPCPKRYLDKLKIYNEREWQEEYEKEIERMKVISNIEFTVEELTGKYDEKTLQFVIEVNSLEELFDIVNKTGKRIVIDKAEFKDKDGKSIDWEVLIYNDYIE